MKIERLTMTEGYVQATLSSWRERIICCISILLVGEIRGHLGKTILADVELKMEKDLGQ